ncbi:Hypothetical protein POVR1_LOCUS336 [uncultured virus]|nr:Hypothetical protein POVR1_LOCUS336 [uncultured virus]
MDPSEEKPIVKGYSENIYLLIKQIARTRSYHHEYTLKPIMMINLIVEYIINSYGSEYLDRIGDSSPTSDLGDPITDYLESNDPWYSNEDTLYDERECYRLCYVVDSLRTLTFPSAVDDVVLIYIISSYVIEKRINLLDLFTTADISNILYDRVVIYYQKNDVYVVADDLFVGSFDYKLEDYWNDEEIDTNSFFGGQAPTNGMKIKLFVRALEKLRDEGFDYTLPYKSDSLDRLFVIYTRMANFGG